MKKLFIAILLLVTILLYSFEEEHNYTVEIKENIYDKFEKNQDIIKSIYIVELIEIVKIYMKGKMYNIREIKKHGIQINGCYFIFENKKEIDNFMYNNMKEHYECELFHNMSNEEIHQINKILNLIIIRKYSINNQFYYDFYFVDDEMIIKNRKVFYRTKEIYIFTIKKER
jgi:hypothetical protein